LRTYKGQVNCQGKGKPNVNMADSLQELRKLQATLNDAIAEYEKSPGNKGIGDKIANTATKIAESTRDPFEECMKFGFRVC
jgi:hypothetical protein